MHLRNLVARTRTRLLLNVLFIAAVLMALTVGYGLYQARANSTSSQSTNAAFTGASQATGVPVELLKAVCYVGGRLTNNGGGASEDNGYGCTHLVRNQNFDTLDQAAQATGLSTNQLMTDLNANIRGGAFVLRAEALKLSSNQNLPANLNGWYNTLVVYSDTNIHSIALMYANSVFQVLQKGFTAPSETGEIVTLAPQDVQLQAPLVTTPVKALTTKTATPAALPGGCRNDGNVDYPGAIDCILTNPNVQDCNVPTSPSNCNYTSSNRPTSCTVDYSTTDQVVTQPCNIDQVVIHDTEGSLTSALSVFQCLNNGPNSACGDASVHYLIDTDGTVYQVLREQNIAYHDGNFWSNMHSIGIEHVGVDQYGYLWYNSAQYEASAKLTAYLLKKYHLPLDRDHIVAHATVSSSDLASSPNHVDPGPYWLWDYYFNLISQQGVPISNVTPAHTITLHPQSDQAPDGPNGTETTANFNFFDLYNGPSTSSGLIPQQGSGGELTDVSYNVEAGMTYAYLAKASDSAGTGDTMYEIWYGEEDQVHTSNRSYFADAHLAWLAVPPGDGVEGPTGKKPGVFYISPLLQVLADNSSVYGRPTSNSQYVIGQAPAGAIFYAGYAVTEDNASALWYEINFNHRQAWIPASEVTFAHLPPVL